MVRGQHLSVEHCLVQVVQIGTLDVFDQAYLHRFLVGQSLADCRDVFPPGFLAGEPAPLPADDLELLYIAGPHHDRLYNPLLADARSQFFEIPLGRLRSGITLEWNQALQRNQKRGKISRRCSRFFHVRIILLGFMAMFSAVSPRDSAGTCPRVVPRQASFAGSRQMSIAGLSIPQWQHCARDAFCFMTDVFSGIPDSRV